jgi:GrpB-like predicted nucleotidyltransferase (UPF0157 family)
MSPKRTRAKAAIVREVKRVDEPISVEAYDSEWPAQYATEAARLRKGLDGSVLAIEHIGSTAVVGLAAKPIIDVMVGVDELNTTDDLASHSPSSATKTAAEPRAAVTSGGAEPVSTPTFT